MNDIFAIAEAAGVDTSHRNQHGKYTCPSCSQEYLVITPRKCIAKCFGCGWVRTERTETDPYQRSWVVAAMRIVRDTMTHYLREGPDDCHLRRAALNYLLQDRKLDKRIINMASIGIVPPSWDPTKAIDEAQRAIMLEAKVWDSEPDKKKKAGKQRELDEQKALLDDFTCKLKMHASHAGWIAFFYENDRADAIAANFRRISKDAEGKNVINWLKPLKQRGVFFPVLTDDCLGHNGRVLCTEGEINQLRFLSERVRHGDQHGETLEECLEASITLGASTGQDIECVRRLLANEDATPDKAVILHDNDAAGRKAAKTFVWGQSAYVITTPDPHNDIDELFNAKPKAEGVLAWLQKKIAEAPHCIRPIEATAEQVDEIRANEIKAKAHRVEETLCEVILADMRERGKFVVDTLPYAWLPGSKQLIKLKKDSPEFYNWLGQYRLLEKQPHFNIVEAKVISEATNKGEQVQVHRLIHSTLDSCYLSTGGDRMIKISADEIKYVPNGTDDVYMVPDPNIQLPELEPMLLGDTTIGMKVNGSKLSQYLNALAWDDRAMSGPRMQQLFMARVLVMFFFAHVGMRPIIAACGEQDSGKTSLLENIGRLFYGVDWRAVSLPNKIRDMVAKLTNNELAFFNNTDNVDLEEQGYLNLFCNAAFGEADESAAQLYKDNVELSWRISTNIGLASRDMNFNRSDVMRRTLVFALKKPPKACQLTKPERRQMFIEDHSELLHELLSRVQHVLVALKATEGRLYNRVSDMDEMEMFMLRVADHEGWLDECREIWTAYQTDYKEDITVGDPLAQLLDLWIGSAGPGREVTTTSLWQESEKIFTRLNIPMTYKAPAVLGRHLGKGGKATVLAQYGYRFIGNSHSLHVFNPKPEMAARCKRAFRDAMVAATGEIGYPADRVGVAEDVEEL